MAINAERNQRVRQKLLGALKTERTFALTGAGVSFWAGYKLWPGVLQSLAADVNERFPGEHNTDVIIANNVADPLICAQKLGKILGNRYHDFIRREFGPRERLRNDVLLRIIALPFRHFLTLNFDNSIEAAHTIVGKACPSLTSAEIRDMSKFLLQKDTMPRHMVHLHGLYTDPTDHIALAEEGYKWLYSHTIFKKFFWSLFASHTLVFMGLGFQDLDLNIAMRESGRDFDDTDLTHFALVGIKNEQNDDELRNNFKRFLTEPVFYPVVGNDHSEFINFINGLLADLEIPNPGDNLPSPVNGPPVIPPPQPINADLDNLSRIQEAVLEQLDPEGEQQ